MIMNRDAMTGVGERESVRGRTVVFEGEYTMKQSETTLTRGMGERGRRYPTETAEGKVLEPGSGGQGW